MTVLPFDDRDGWLSLDGSLVPWRAAKLHVLSHGLHGASAVFEGERAYAGNIFRLRDHTNGITRRTVISLARHNRMKATERAIPPADLARPTEVFLAGTAAEVTVVREIGAHRFRPGMITETLTKDYDALVLKATG